MKAHRSSREQQFNATNRRRQNRIGGEPLIAPSPTEIQYFKNVFDRIGGVCIFFFSNFVSCKISTSTVLGRVILSETKFEKETNTLSKNIPL